MSQLGRITGPLLKANLLRDGVDLAFETDLLYLDVVNGKIGINTTSPTHDLQVVGTTRTTNLEATTPTSYATVATFTLANNTISSTDGTINLEPFGANPVVYQAKLTLNSNLQLSTNTIETTVTDSDLNINTLGTGEVKINSNVLINGDLHGTGNITADGDITIGDGPTDIIVFNSEIASNVIPNATNTYDLGSDPLVEYTPGEFGKAWKTAYVQDLVATNITANTVSIDGIDLALPQGNTIYVAKNGDDANAGVHENNPLLTIKAALAQAVSGDTVMVFPGVYQEVFPLTVPVGVTVRGAGIRSVAIKPTTETRYNDAFWLNGETTVEDLAVMDFFSGGNFYTVTSASAGSTTFNVGIAPFAHAYDSGGTINISGTDYAVTGATYDYTTGIITVTHAGPDATGLTIFLSNLTFTCNGSSRVFPDNGYGFRFAPDFTVTTRSPYVRNITVITRGTSAGPSDPYGFVSGDAGKGAYIDGAYATALSNEAAMLFHSVTFITPNVDTITAKNGVRVEWLNSFTYFANKGINAFSSNYGFAQQGQTRLRINNRTGTWAVGNTLTYYDTDGTTVLASGTISAIDGDYVNLTGRQVGFQTITDRLGKTVYAQGDAQLSTSIRKFGTASVVLDGTGDYASLATQPDFEFGTNDFTIETWVYPTATGTYRTLFDFRSTAGDTGGIILGLSDINALYFFYNGNYRIGPVGSVPINTWSHIALCKSSGTTRAFVNGTQVGLDYTDSNTYAQRGIRIGADPNGNFAFTGNFDDVRITNGTAKYTTSFVAPTTALTGDLSTVLLLHFNGTNGSTTFLDDGVTFQDLRTSAGGTATVINFADYSDFGAEIRSIGSANVYGNYGTYGDGQGVVIYLISQNYAYVGSGKKSTNDPNDRIAANEVVKLNNAQIYYTSVDNEGNFSVGDSFYVNQKTGDVLFNNQNLTISSLTGVIFSDGVNTTTVTATNIDTGNLRISGNTVESLTGAVNITAADGTINLQNNTFVAGTFDVTGNTTLNGDVTLGNLSTDNINFIGSINTDIIPSLTETYDLGTDLLRWNTGFFNRVEVDGLIIDNNTISTSLGNDDLQLVANGTGKIYIPSSDVLIDQNLTVDTDLTVTTGTTYLKDVGITGTVTQTGDIDQTGDFTTTGNTEVTGNIIGTGYVQLPNVRIENNIVSTTITDTNLELQANGTGNVVVEGIKVSDNNIQSVATNSDITLVPQGTGNVIINSTQSLQIPVGTTAERPDPASNGMIRYNTDLQKYEGYNNGLWLVLSGVQDADGTTRIIAEATPGANDNVIYFYVDDVLMATLDSTKLFVEKLQTANLDISGNTISAIAPNTDIIFTTAGTGGVKLGNVRIRNNTITNVSTNAVTEFAQAGEGYVRIAGTNGVVIPSGDTLTQRPITPELGMIRFNVDGQLVEVYNGVSWSGVAGESGGVTTVEATELGITAALIFG